MKKLSVLLASAAMVALVGHAHAAGAPVSTSGGVLTDSSGMTLYTFDHDANGKSACNGPCATNWPPLLASAGDKASGDYQLVQRDDGKQQWAYKGKPLYTWSKDRKPGDKTGDGFKNMWHVVHP